MLGLNRMHAISTVETLNFTAVITVVTAIYGHTLLLSPKNVIDAVQSEGNLNQIGSLRRKMTIICNGNE